MDKIGQLKEAKCFCDGTLVMDYELRPNDLFVTHIKGLNHPETYTCYSNKNDFDNFCKMIDSLDIPYNEMFKKGEIMPIKSIDAMPSFGAALYHVNEKLEIKKVVFNDPATIVFWSDGTKTVVKAGDKDKFDPEKGLAMAMVKKLYGGNKGNYYKVFHKWLSKYYEEADAINSLLDNLSF